MSADVTGHGPDGTAARRTPRWIALTIAILFGLFYAYDAWAGIGNLVGLNLAAQALDTRLSGFGWGVLAGGVLLPGLAYGVAYRLGRGRGLGARVLLYLAGLSLVSALAADIHLFGLGSLIV